MISYLQGKIILKKEKFIILDVDGVGYKVFLSKKSILEVPEIGQELKLYCFQDVKETALDLYGFFDYKELEFFEVLNDIRGIGPKVAIEIASLGPLDNLKERILKQDENIFTGIPGIGKKRAMAIILELTGKIKNIASTKKSGAADEVEDALIGLGFPKQRVKEALPKIPENITDLQEKIKIALKYLGQK